MKKPSEILASIEGIMKAQIIQSKNVLSLQEAALQLDLSEAMLYKMTSERLIPHFKPSGKKIYFKREDLDAWALSNEVKTIGEIGKGIISGNGKPKS